MHLFLEVKIKVLLNRLFHVQIILKKYINVTCFFVTGKCIRETFLGMGCVVSGIVKLTLSRPRWTSIVFIDINLSVYYFKYFSGKSFILTGYSSTDYLMNCNSREIKMHSGALE